MRSQFATRQWPEVVSRRAQRISSSSESSSSEAESGWPFAHDQIEEWTKATYGPGSMSAVVFERVWFSSGDMPQAVIFAMAGMVMLFMVVEVESRASSGGSMVVAHEVF